MILTLILDRVILHAILHHSSTSTYMPNFIETEETFCGRRRMYIRMNGRTFETHFIRSTQRSRPNNSDSACRQVSSKTRVMAGSPMWQDCGQTDLAAFLFSLLFGGCTTSRRWGCNDTVNAVDEANYLLDFLVVEQRCRWCGANSWWWVTGKSWRFGRRLMVWTTSSLRLVLSLLLQHTITDKHWLQTTVINCRNQLLLLPTSSTRTSPAVDGLLAPLVYTVVNSPINYCNAVLAGAPRTVTDKLQRMLNAAVCVVTGTCEFDRGLGQIPHDELHWLDVPDRVFFKLAVTVHRCLNGCSLPYLSDYWVPAAWCWHSAAPAFCQSSTTCSTSLPAQHLRPSGLFSCRPHSLEPSPDFIRDPNISADCFRRLLKT